MKMISRMVLLFVILNSPNVLLAQKKPVKPNSQTAVLPVEKTEKNPPFMLKGFAPAFPDSMVVMVTSKNDQMFRGPSAMVKNGQFLLTGKLPEPGIYNLLLTNPKRQDQSRYIDMFLTNEASAIQFTGNSGDFSVLEGSSLKAFSALIQNFGNDFDVLSRLQQMRQVSGTNIDSINTAWKITLNRVYENVPVFIKEHRSTPVAPFLLLTIWPVASTEVNLVDQWLQQIDSAALTNDFGVAIKEYVNNEKMFGYGQPAPIFVQNDPEGHPVDLKSFRGKYVLIDFWASWCGPCRLENPNVVNVYHKFKSKNFTVLGVSLDREKAKWLQAIDQDQLKWTQVSDLAFWNNSVAKLYRVQSIPQNFLLDPEGKIIGKNLRGENLDNFLYSLLGSN